MYKILKTDCDEVLVPVEDYDSVFEQYMELMRKKRHYSVTGNYGEMYTIIGFKNKLLEPYMTFDEETVVVMPEVDYSTTLQAIIASNEKDFLDVTHDEIFPNYLCISKNCIKEYFYGDEEDGDADVCYGSEVWNAKPHLLLASGWRIHNVK